MAPSLADVSFAGRGFPAGRSAATRKLEAIPQAVVCGFEWGIEALDQWELERRLSLTDPEVQGFAYEGATMACVVRDAMAGGRGTRTLGLLQGEGKRHIFLNYIGIGFAMARLPRPLWKKVLPELTGPEYYPEMSWLAVDGLGFDRAYFDTERWVDRQQLPAPYPWAGHPDYFARAFDQGIGRALWFIHGARADEVAAAVGRFAARRRPDLWSGVGLAATFAGAGDPEDLAALREAAGEHRGELAQGAAFAAKARHHSGTVPEHTRAATLALTSRSVEEVAVIADDCAATTGEDGEPAYEIWRRRVREHLSTTAVAV
jgi:hypothetical protein